MRFIVYFEKHGISYYEDNCSAWRVHQLKQRYYVYEVRRRK